MAYYSTHSISQFLLNNEKQRVRFLLAHPVHMAVGLPLNQNPGRPIYHWRQLAMDERYSRVVVSLYS